jgi:PKD repeat protein
MNVKLPGNDCYIERNIFVDADVIQIELRNSTKVYVRNNVFYQPTGYSAIANSHDADSSELIIEYNSFLSTDRINLWVGTGSHPVNITAINNYWNTTDTDVINDMIYDHKDDIRCSVEIVYEPFLTAPHPDTPVFPTANFSADTTIGLPPLTVIFTDESIGPIDSWEWDLGDGSTSDQQDPIHIYENLGRYTVSLNVSGPIASDTVVKTDYITVGDAPDLVGKCKEFHSYEFGASIKVKVAVENTGTDKASRFNVALYLSDDGTTRSELIGLETVKGGLNSQHTKVVSLGYESENRLSGKYIITVIDPDSQVLEFDETDNEFATRIP